MSSKHTRTAISVTRKPKESSERLVQRFQKKAQASRIVIEVKERQYFKKKPRKRHIRAAAVMREYYRERREKEKYH